MPGITASSPDIATIATNLAVFTAAIVASVAGLYTGLRKVRDGKPAPGDMKLPAGVIIETHTMLGWSESNKDVKLALEAVHKSNESLTRSNYHLAEVVKDLCHEVELMRVIAGRRD